MVTIAVGVGRRCVPSTSAPSAQRDGWNPPLTQNEVLLMFPSRRLALINIQVTTYSGNASHYRSLSGPILVRWLTEPALLRLIGVIQSLDLEVALGRLSSHPSAHSESDEASRLFQDDAGWVI